MHSSHRILALAVLTLGGCASPQHGPTGSDGLSAAIADYEAGRYEAARLAATDVAIRGNGVERDAGQYIAGLAAYRLGDTDEAERRLSSASTSRDVTTAAKAKAALGLVHLSMDHPRDAAVLFEAAAPGLSGPDADQAAQFARTARIAAGDDPDATAPRIARGASSVGFGSYSTPHGAGGTSFSLQVGAFEERDRAEAAAREARSLADRSLGDVRITPHADSRGRRLYFVQLGRFTTRAEATRARTDLGRLEYIVATTLE